MAYIIRVNRTTNSYSIRRVVRNVVVNRVGKPGLTGAQGQQGVKGDKGDQGIQGVPGATGATGAKGEKGDKGDTGAQGIQGSQGIQGVPGVKGEKGDKGDQGEQGIQGVPGQDGAPGVVQSIQAGANITVNNADPANPIVSSTGGGGGSVSFDDITDKPLAPAFTGVLVNNASDEEFPTDQAQYSIQPDPMTFAYRDDDGTLRAAPATELDHLVQKIQLDMIEEELFTDIQNGDAATLSSANAYTDAEIAAIDFPVDSVAGKTGNVTLVKGDVGLGNVDNTSDLAKPISTATQTALNAKLTQQAVASTVYGINGSNTQVNIGYSNAATNSTLGLRTTSGQLVATDPTAPAHLTTKNYVDAQDALKANIASPTFTGTVSGITKAMVGLGNADNTSDANKPVSTATQTALDGKENSFAKGSLVQGSNVTLSGTLANRLVGSGDITISANGGGGGDYIPLNASDGSVTEANYTDDSSLSIISSNASGNTNATFAAYGSNILSSNTDNDTNSQSIVDGETGVTNVFRDVANNYDSYVSVGSYGASISSTFPDANMDMNGLRIINTVDPILDTDVATKKYVDDNSGGGSAFNPVRDIIENPFFFWDYRQAPLATVNYGSGAIASGTTTYVQGDSEHFGVANINKSTTANSGAQSLVLNQTSMGYATGGEEYWATFRPQQVGVGADNVTVNLGFTSSNAMGLPVNGMLVSYAGATSSFFSRTVNNSTQTFNTFVSSAPVNSWYTVHILVDTTATSVLFEVYDNAMALLGTVTHTTNIPNASNRSFSAGVVATHQGTTAGLICELDYQYAKFGNFPNR